MSRNPRPIGSGAKEKPQSEILGAGVSAEDAKSLGSGTFGAQHNPVYLHTSAEYIAVRRSDLREIARFGWLQEGIGAVGMFFIAGATWMVATLYFEHMDHPEEIKMAGLFGAACVLFGLVLIWISHSHFSLREQRIQDYFKEENSERT